MSHKSVSVVKLDCVGCGANLEISPTMEKLACSHCGTKQIVERSGGVVHLHGVTEAISKVQAGTDRTAAELAIVRLQNEVQVELMRRESVWQVLANDRIAVEAKWATSIDANRTKVVIVSVIGGVLGTIPAILFTMMVYQFLFYLIGAQAASVGVFAVICGFAAGAILTYLWTQKNGRFSGEALMEQRDLELSMVDARIRTEMAKIDQHLSSLSMNIQKNREIANGQH